MDKAGLLLESTSVNQVQQKPVPAAVWHHLEQSGLCLAPAVTSNQCHPALPVRLLLGR